MEHKRKAFHIVVAALILASFLAAGLSPSSAVAAGDTVVGVLTLTPAIENISIISSFSGDDTGNNNATLEYREVGSSTWKSGIPMTVDRRDELWEFPETSPLVIPNPYKNQWRAIIFGLTPDTEYEVRVQWALLLSGL